MNNYDISNAEYVVPILGNSNRDIKWFQNDSEQEFLQNKKKFGKSWKFSNTDFNYKFNHYGYRSVDPRDIKNDNFFITMGCSYTLGLGLPVEDTYSDLLSKKLGLDYLNLGVAGGSQLLVWMNSAKLVEHYKRTPKFVVCQWPQLFRINLFEGDHFYSINANIIAENRLDNTRKGLFEALVKEQTFLYHNAEYYFKSVQLFWKMRNVPVYNITFDLFSCELFKIKYLIWKEDDLARDHSHPGVIFNEEVSEYLFNEIKND